VRYRAAMRPCAFALLFAAACKEESDPLPPPGEGPGVVASASGAGTGSGGGGSLSSGGGEGGVPLPDMPASCGCMASAGDEACRACIDASAEGACADAAAACGELGERYCALVFDCITLCATPDIYCVDTCLGAKDSARDVVETFVACACSGCSAECGDGACE
jgi:hypothetical protein